MKRQNVDSSNIRSIGYDEKTEILEVEFQNSHIYQFEGVGKSVHKKLLKAESIGKTFNESVRRKFNFKKVL
jgi:hypothetical protein